MKIKSSRNVLIIPATIIAFLILLIIAVNIVQQFITNWEIQTLLQDRGVNAEAVVTQLHEPRSTGSSTIEYQFVVRSSTRIEEDYSGRADIPRSDVHRFQPGTRVMIIYDPENPELSRLKNPAQNYSFVTNLTIVITAFIGIIAIIAAWIRLLLMKR